MGNTVLDAGTSRSPQIRLYAHCQEGRAGGVSILAINLDTSTAQTITLPAESVRYTLSAKELSSREVQLNDKALVLLDGDRIPTIAGAPTASGVVMLPPASSSFFTIASAKNANCN